MLKPHKKKFPLYKNKINKLYYYLLTFLLPLLLLIVWAKRQGLLTLLQHHERILIQVTVGANFHMAKTKAFPFYKIKSEKERKTKGKIKGVAERPYQHKAEACWPLSPVYATYDQTPFLIRFPIIGISNPNPIPHKNKKPMAVLRF